MTQRQVVTRRGPMWFAAGVVLSALAACGGGEENLVDSQGSKQVSRETGPTAPLRTDQQDRSFAPAQTATVQREQSRATGGFSIDLAQREASRLFYTTVFNASEGVNSGWTGSLGGCTPGDTSTEHKEAVLRRINWFRAMAGVPANVQFDSTFNRKAQQAALVMAANNNLSHTPPATWACNNAEATEAAGSSNLALGRAGADSVAGGYMADGGSNNAAVGHRRWVLYPQTQTMGTGDVTGSASANALWVFDNRFSAARPTVRDEFVAWPPPGYVPYPTVYPRWSFSYPKADFSTATVTMTENGVILATRKEAVSNGAGENTLVWLPGAYTDGMQWARPSADTAYTVQINGVKVNGVARSFSYTVKVFDPGVATQTLSLSGSDSAAVGQANAYSFVAMPGATGYQWRTLHYSPVSFSDGAEGELTQFSAQISSGYSVQASGVSASGARSFHLAHPSPVDQILAVNGEWVPTSASQLAFASRLGLSSPNQWARVDVSQDGGASWTALYEQAGAQSGSTSSSGETTFSSKQVSLAAYSGRTIRLRFVYGFTGGSYYPQTSNTGGWFIDDVRIDAVNQLTSTDSPIDVGNATQFNFTPNQVGGVLLQVRPGMYGLFGEWSPVKSVTVTSASGVPPSPPVSVGASPAAIDCLFNWAQGQFPTVLTPATAVSQTVSPYRFRFYAQSGVYLGVSSADQALYAVLGGKLESFGPVSGWLAQAGCTGL